MRTGYFMRADAPPETLDPRFDVVVMPWRTLWQDEWSDAAYSYQTAGIKVFVHVPWSYINPEATTPAHERIKAELDAHDGWLLGPEGQRVPQERSWRLIDPRSHRLRRQLLKAHLQTLHDTQFEPDGLFLDFLWDRVAWNHEFDGLDRAAKAELDDTYRDGMYAFTTGLVFQMRKAHIEAQVYVNGWHTCTVADGAVLEGFPLHKKENGERGLHVELMGEYGKRAWGAFREAPMLMPAGGTNTVYNLPPFRVVEAVAFAHTYCPDAIVFDNSGLIFDVLAYVIDERKECTGVTEAEVQERRPRVHARTLQLLHDVTERVHPRKEDC